MEETKTRNQSLEYDHDLDEEVAEYDELSFCDFSMVDDNLSSVQNSPRVSSAPIDQHFEFLITSQPESAYTNPKILSCRKLIHEQELLNEYQKRDYFATIQCHSTRKPEKIENRLPISSPNRFSGELARFNCSTRDLSYHTQIVNITALTSMSVKSKRRMFMFGPVKFKPEMELSAIKQRQGRQRSHSSTGVGKTRWERIRSVVTSEIVGVLMRSFGCIPMTAGVD